MLTAGAMCGWVGNALIVRGRVVGWDGLSRVARCPRFAQVMESMEKKSGEGNREVKEVKKKAQSELAEVVRKHNAKFNEMLAQRLVEEEAAKEAARRAADSEWESKSAEREGLLKEQLHAATAAAAELQAKLAQAQTAAVDAERRASAAEAEAAESAARLRAAEMRTSEMGAQLEAQTSRAEALAEASRQKVRVGLQP